MRRSDIEGEITGHDANQAGDLSRSAARGTSVIPFPRPHPSRGPGAGVVPPTTPANFESLGSVVRSVVLRIQDDRVRLHVESSVPVYVLGGEGEDRDG